MPLVRKKAQGFSLIEIMIALAIFAVIAIIATQSLNISLKTKKKLSSKLATLEEIKLAYVIIKRDLEQVIDRPVLNSDGEQLPGLMVPVSSTDKIGYRVSEETAAGLNLLEFTRIGYTHSILSDHATALQRVAYYLHDNTLLRYSWRNLNHTKGSKPDVRKLLHNVEKLQLKFVGSTGNVASKWHTAACIPSVLSLCQKSGATVLPVGIKMQVILSELGEVNWNF